MADTVLTPQSRLCRNPSIFASKVDEELVMMDQLQGLYFGLNPVGRKVWELLESPLEYEELVSCLGDLYEVDKERCEADIKPFLNALIQHQLVQITNE